MGGYSRGGRCLDHDDGARLVGSVLVGSTPFAVGAADARESVIAVGNRLREGLFLAMVALLPLHTVFVRAWVAWKPFLVLLACVVACDLATRLRTRRWPWHGPVSRALAVLLLVLLLGYPGAAHRDGFVRLWLAVVAGGLVLLTTEHGLRSNGAKSRLLRVLFASAVVMAITGPVFTLAAVGALGQTTLEWVNDLPGVYRVAKAAYLDEGFVVLTNWHHEAGYGASWATMWAVLVLVASSRGLGSRRWWLDGAVIGGLAFSAIAAFSRAAWLTLPSALLATTALLTMSRRARVRDLIRLLAVAFVVALLLVALVWAVDPPGAGGDFDLQFAFRWQQGCDLLGSLGLWWASDVGLEDAFSTSEKRPEVWAWYLNAFVDNPMLGIGLGTGRDITGFEPHNLVVELLAETGVFGLLAFLLVLGVVIREGGGITGTVALIAAFLPLMTLTVFYEPTWWFAAGLLLGGRHEAQEGGSAALRPSRTVPPPVEIVSLPPGQSAGRPRTRSASRESVR